MVRERDAKRWLRVQYTMYPPSLYENIVRGAALGVPMYITEIGAADKSADDHIRLANIESSVHQVRPLPCFSALACRPPARMTLCGRCLRHRLGHHGRLSGVRLGRCVRCMFKWSRSPAVDSEGCRAACR